MAAAADIALHETMERTEVDDSEFAVLLACCRGQLADTPLPEQVDWQHLLSAAEHHRVLPALFTAMREGLEIPAAVRAALSAKSYLHLQSTLCFCAELAGILRSFSTSKIDVLPLKGPVLSQILYGDSAARQFGDLDLLVRQNDVPRAKAALEALGYKPTLRLTPCQQRAYLRSGYEYVFTLQGKKCLVELQWQILPRFYSISFDIESLFARSMELAFDGQCVRTLGKEDLMLVLCAHGAKHEWEQLGIVRDIAALLASDLDWQWIHAEAQRLGISRIVQISLMLAHRLFAAPLPQIFKSSAETRVSGRWAHLFEARLRASSMANPVSIGYFRTMLELREQWQDRARFAWRLATTPSIGEWDSVVLPEPLFPIYCGIRAFRLMRRLVRGA